MPEPIQERRRFQRIVTDKPIIVRDDDGAHNGTTLDLSLRGLLIESDEAWRPQTGSAVSARIRLDDDACCIDMDGTIAHVAGNRIGIEVTSVDIDSAGQLRRMVELNLGDHGLLERELTELLSA